MIVARSELLIIKENFICKLKNLKKIGSPFKAFLAYFKHIVAN